jgi:lambda family phage minor tail protein L
MTTLFGDVQLLEPGALIELFEFDATGIGGGFLRFHGYGRDVASVNITWNGVVYSPWPIEAQGFARTSDQQPVPTIAVGNLDGSITSLCLSFDDLVGAKLTRLRTLGQYLDAVNFTGGVNPTADPTQAMPSEIWYIERKSVETAQSVVFELSSPLNFQGRQLPGRQVIANLCLWLTIGGYRGPYCSYAGGAVALADDTPTAILANDKCGGRISSCKLRFGANNQLPFGGCPGAGLVRS